MCWRVELEDEEHSSALMRTANAMMKMICFVKNVAAEL